MDQPLWQYMAMGVFQTKPQHTTRDEGKMSDDVAITRIAQGDAVVFRQVVDAHVTALHRLAYRMLGDASAAEDIAQEALLRLWTYAKTHQGTTFNCAAWLRRVSTNLCLDCLRRRKFQSGEDVPEMEDDAPLADAMIEAQQKRATVKAALGALGDRQRAAIVLTYYEELPNAEAAEMMNMNIKAFESLLLRARASLKSALLTEGEGSI
jgi:RNA polymerase sigma factor (sigma-70 family)